MSIRFEEHPGSAWLIERPSDTPGRPHYWMDTVGGYGLGTWTQDPWKATRYATEEAANRAIARWVAHPTVTDAKAVEHGFIAGVATGADE